MQLMIEIIQWDTDVSDQQNKKKKEKTLEILKRFIEERDFPTLISVLKFSTGHSFISSLNHPKIKIEYLHESKVMLETQVNFSLLYWLVK